MEHMGLKVQFQASKVCYLSSVLRNYLRVVAADTFYPKQLMNKQNKSTAQSNIAMEHTRVLVDALLISTVYICRYKGTRTYIYIHISRYMYTYICIWMIMYK